MTNYTKKILPFIMAFVVLASSMGVALLTIAESSIHLELNGGTMQGSSAISPGDLLPNYEKLTKSGATFGGWYSDADFTGIQTFSVPADVKSGTTYYARWIKHDINFDNFDVYTSDTDLLTGHWDDWKWPAQNTVTTLNTDANHAYSGKSMKIAPNDANKKTNVVNQTKSYLIQDTGVAFWIESTGTATVQLRFNQKSDKTGDFQLRTIPAGKFLLTIPWSEIASYANGKTEFWSTQIFVTVTNAADVVYVDSMGTFTDCTEGTLFLDTNGGNWISGYSAPEKYTPGMILPTMDNICRDGMVFAGWYDNVGFIGKPNYTVPTTVSGNATYYARWVEADISYSDFESYTDTGVITSVDTEGDGNTVNDATNGFINEETGKKGFYFWGGVAGTTVQLNTDSAHAISGSKSAKLVLNPKNAATLYNTTQFGSDRIYFPSDKDLGEGICFWVETNQQIKLDIQLNYNIQSAKITLPEGRHFVTVPWSELNNKKAPWITLIRITNPTEKAVVYIDDIGTYTVSFDNKINFHLNGGSCVDGYDLPTGYNILNGLTLPNCDQITKDGLTFAGWYDNAGLTGDPVYSIPADSTGDKEFWAKWLVHDVNFDNFDSYDIDSDLLNDNHWSDWKWPAQNAVTTLNVDAAHAHNGGKSMKVCLNAENKNDELVVSRKSYAQVGDGIAFWMESTDGASVQVKFNGSKSYVSSVKTVVAGKVLVTIPWSEIAGAKTGINFWQLSLLVSVPTASGVVYIDEIGTYSENIDTANTVSYFVLNGNWATDYTAPTRYSSAGTILPDCSNIAKQGYVFAGWYTEKDYSGDAVTVTPASGNIKLFAKWVKYTSVFEDFDSYSGSTGWDAWSNSTSPSLCTEGGKSLKIGVASKNAFKENYATVCKNKVFTKAGDGVAFWVKTEVATEIRVAFNDQNKYYSVNAPAGKSYVTVPWNVFTLLPEGDAFNPMFIRVLTLDNNVANTVYVDDIGTYADNTERLITYHLNEGEFIDGAEISSEMDPEKETVLPTDVQVKKEGFFFAGWYGNEELTGTPVLALKPEETKNREFWAKWVEQVNINYDFEDFADSKALETAGWMESTPYEGWRESGSVKIYLEKDRKNLAPDSTKGLRAE